MSRKSVIIATRQAQDLERWQEVLSETDDLQIMAHVPDLMALFNTVEHGPPNVVLVASDLCAAEEFELIVTLFDALDVRWLMFHSLGSAPSASSSDMLLNKSGGLFSLSLTDNKWSLISQVLSTAHAAQKAERPLVVKPTSTGNRYKRIVLIGSSTGGVDALKTVLSKFGADCPPTVIVQHTTKGFGAGLVRVLTRCCAARVKLFEPNAALQTGTVYVVAGHGQHVVMTAERRPHLQVSDGPPMSGHCPSIDRLFVSSVPFAPRTVACILTGMGTDGAEGLMQLRQAGARTLSQDRETSVVYGMPGAAWSMGASMQQVSLAAMGDTILKEARL